MWNVCTNFSNPGVCPSRCVFISLLVLCLAVSLSLGLIVSKLECISVNMYALLTKRRRAVYVHVHLYVELTYLRIYTARSRVDRRNRWKMNGFASALFCLPYITSSRSNCSIIDLTSRRFSYETLTSSVPSPPFPDCSIVPPSTCLAWRGMKFIKTQVIIHVLKNSYCLMHLVYIRCLAHARTRTHTRRGPEGPAQRQHD